MAVVFPQAVSASASAVTKELEYVHGIIEDGITLGEPENFALAHRVMGNLSVTLENMENIHRRTMFTMAVAFNYVRMCPHSFMQEADVETAFTVDCTKEALKYINESAELARERLDRQSAADAYFVAGVGLDRLKTNLNDIPGADTREYYFMARDFFLKAGDMNTGFGGISRIIGKYNMAESKTSAVVTEEQFDELFRMLIYRDPQPKAVKEARASAGGMAEESVSARSEIIDDNTFINYKWRFSISRPDDTWKFVVRKGSNSLHVNLRRKGKLEQKGSGLNIICRTLKPEDADAPLGELVAKSEKLLEQAGYEINSKQQFDFNGLQAYKIISQMEYSDLVASEQGSGGGQLVSQQYMLVTKSNGIQYIISFTGLKDEYPRLFTRYQSMVNTAKFF